MKKLFGTDGVRGRANLHPITPEIALQLGKAIAQVFESSGHGSRRAVIGKDTRLSGYMLESALTSGLVSMGMDVYLVGPMPTPAVAHLTKSMGAAAGLMITASHNPAEDNGIKVFNREGFKLSDELEAQIEALVLEGQITSHHITYDQIGKAHRIEDARGRYIEYAKSTVDNLDLRGLKIVVDCANGASYFLGPLIFKELGAEVVKMGVTPDGYNINRDCGALHLDAVAAKVVETGADLGIAFDGDADRLVVCGSDGQVIHGDRLIGLCAIDLKADARLQHDTVVATVMSGLGLHQAMAANGIEVVTSAVGDRSVLEKLRGGGYNFGGEESGHLIYLDYATTGDGIISALQVLKIRQQRQTPLAELGRMIEVHPRQLVNVQVAERRELAELPLMSAALAECDLALGDGGRQLVRYSGTENKLRILVEAEKQADVDYWCGRLSEVARQELCP